jgi:hypothetical protein
MPTDDLTYIATINDDDMPSAILETAALGPFVAGIHRFSLTHYLVRVRADASLLPPGVEADRVAIEPNWRLALASGDDWQLCVRRWGGDQARVTVTAVSEARCEEIIELATRDAVEDVIENDDSVAIGFWHLGGRGPSRSERDIAVRPWDAICANYTARSAGALSDAMTMGPPDRPGRLLLLHGPPGTGKTTALRALAHAWRSWAQMDYVLDPERLFGEPGYLLQVALGDDTGSDRWRLLVLEDCDELIAANAKYDTGQGLSRLLNLTDGLLGQGLEVLVCITTNEPLARLHPAIVRPGRCLAEIEVGALTRAEALAWLGAAEGVPAEGATLAELLAMRGDLAPPQRATPEERRLQLYL